MDTASFTLILAEFGKGLGLEGLTLDDSSSCTLIVREVMFTMLWDEASQSLLVFAPIGSLRQTADEAALCRRMMEANCLGSGTGGLTLGVQPGLDAIILSGRIPGAALSAPALSRWIDVFTEQGVHWKQELDFGSEVGFDAGVAMDPAGAEPASQGQPLDGASEMFLNFALRV